MAVITISRGTFSGGKSIAECVARKLGYRSVGSEILEEAARTYNIPNRRLFEAVSTVPSIIEKIHPVRKRYLACLQATLLNSSRNDNMIYHGRAGHFLLKNIPHIIKVRIIASIEFRIGMLINREHLSRNEAEQRIMKMDEERVKWTRYTYHANWYDPVLYDITINLDNLGLSGACDMLCKTTAMDTYKLTVESQKSMEDLILSSHLKAIIANARSIDGGENVKVEVDGGLVTLGGTVGSLMDADRVRTIVRKTNGVIDIISRLKVRLPGVSLARIRVN